MAIEFILLVFGAYLLGSVPAAYLAARLSQGMDIRQYGSGSVGVSNLFRSTTRWAVIPVTIFDLGKGMVVVWVAQWLGMGIAQQVATGLAAIIGHNWPVFLRFNGGRGVLTTLGVALILPLINNFVPWGIITFLALAGAGFLVLHNIPVGVGAGIAALPLVSWGLGEPFPLVVGYLAMFLLMILRRLVAPQTAAQVNKKQLLLNRLLFDRDIRDREAWINRVPISPTKGRRGKNQL